MILHALPVLAKCNTFLMITMHTAFILTAWKWRIHKFMNQEGLEDTDCNQHGNIDSVKCPFSLVNDIIPVLDLIARNIRLNSVVYFEEADDMCYWHHHHR
jgi:hypothetical protein